MQEKVLDNKKNGMGMMVLFILLYAAAAALYCNRCHVLLDSIDGHWNYLAISGMDSLLRIKSAEATGSSSTYFVW